MSTFMFGLVTGASIMLALYCYIQSRKATGTGKDTEK